MRTAVLLKTHFFDHSIEEAWLRLRRQCPTQWDVLIALNLGKESERVPEAASHLPPEAFFLCGNESFLALPYPTKCAREGWRLIPGNADLITLLFAVRRPDYDHYWGIEYDVHYEGDWSDFFAHFAASPADLLTTTIHWQRETPAKTLPSPPFRSPSLAEYRQPDRLWAFLAIYRISRRGVAAIDAAYRAGGG